MRKRFFITILLVISFAPIINAGSGKDTIPTFFGVSYIPALNWNVFNITNDDGKFLKYKFDLNSQSSFEGNFGFQKIGLRLGLSANMEDNLIGKAYKYGGYIGIKNYWLRIQSSKVSGTIYWSGDVPDPAIYHITHNFTNEYFTIDLLKTSRGPNKSQYNNSMGFYWGVGYTSMGFPLKISTLTTPGGRENQVFGIPAYDTLFKAKFYTACFGFDLLRQLSMSGGKQGLTPGSAPKRFAMYASTQDKIGLGPGELSNYGESMAEALNPGKTFVGKKGVAALVHYSLSLGFRYYVPVKPVFLVFAAGYDFEGAAVVDYGGAADTNTDLGYDANFFYLNHGVSFKLYISWIGNR